MNYPSNYHDDDVLAGKDHELTLSTAAIFGIFFGLVALCAVFFGFGYSLGSHKSPTVLPADSTTASSTPTGANFNTFKPAAGQPVGSAAPRPVVDTSGTAPSTTPAATPALAPHPVTSTADTAPAPIVRANPTSTAPARPIFPVAPQPVATTQPAPAGLFVQVAAISVTHPDDATLMVNALRAKGYAAAPPPAADNYIHILIGPFPTRPAAEAILKRLSADGYTAYIK
jgi:cell division septation protein DedD